MRGGEGGKFCRGGTNCRGRPALCGYKNPHSIGFFAMAWGLLIDCFQGGAALCGVCRSSAMLIAFGAASAALDAIKSLTSSSSPSAQPTGFSQASTDLFGLSDGASASGSSAAATGFSGGAQISPSTISALLDAQSQSSTNSSIQFAGSSLSNAGPLSPAPSTSSGAASSTYNAIDQLIQRQQANTIPLAVNPFSVNV